MADTRLDPTLIMSGFEGELYDGLGNFVAEVNTFHAQFNITNSDYQPGGQAQRVAVLQSYHLTLTFTETVIRDDRFLFQIAAALANRQQPRYSFFCHLIRPDGVVGVYMFTSVVPDGALDIANVAPGDVLARSWSWRVNDPLVTGSAALSHFLPAPSSMPPAAAAIDATGQAIKSI